ncbi:MAG: porin [Hyphomicrobiales bacterium]|nr:MAG: porin [Hyphomicrobiales bacterium]
MKLVKSLLLGSTAGIAAVAGAHAADLPSRKAAPVEYVRVCSAYGAGFFYIPGTDTCLRVGGRVRAEYTVGTQHGDFQDSFGTRARGRLNVDARTATAYGTLRTFFRYELTNSSGVYTAGSGFNSGSPVAGTVRGLSGQATLLDLAFVQFGPITAGRAQSFFDFYASDFNFSTIRTADTRLNLLAYTATFGSGFSATVSLEDRSSAGGRENGVASTTLLAPGLLPAPDYPDVVASLRVDQGWGSAQLSGALTQRKAAITLNNGLVASSEELGFAAQAGVKLNLPMLAAGDTLFLQAAYADGALGYLGWTGGFGVGRTGTLILADAAISSVNGRMENSTGFSLVAALRHFWTPTLRSELSGSYSWLKLPYQQVGPGFTGITTRSLDPEELIVAANLVWSPVSGLDIGVEVLYTNLNLRSPVGIVNNAAGRSGLFGIKSEDSIAGRFRIQRDF